MYPDPRVEKFISENFIPLRFHVKDSQAAFDRFGAQWTPTIIMLDSGGTERHRIEGFLPTDDFLAQLKIGLAHSLFGEKKFAEAEKAFRGVAEATPESDAAAEALYWSGVAKYKATNDASALQATAAAFKSRYTNSPWAKKASIWG